MSGKRQFQLICLWIAGSLAALGTTAMAELTFWQHDPATPGEWSNDANWTNGEPHIIGGWNDACIENAGTAVITQNGEACYSLVLGTFAGPSPDGRGTVEVRSGTLDVTSQIIVGSTMQGTFRHSGGAVSTGFITVGYSADPSTYCLSGTGELNVQSGMVLGHYTTGIFEQTGGTVNASGIDCGWLMGHGEYRLHDGSLSNNAIVIGRGTGGSKGTGLFINSGGTHSIDVQLTLGATVDGSGEYRLSGTGTVEVPIEYVGCYGDGQFTQTGGTHTVNSVLYIGGLRHSYYGARSDGEFDLQNGQLTVEKEYVGYEGRGSFTQSGGVHTVQQELTIGHESYVTGVFTLSGGTLAIGGTLEVSKGGPGTLHIKGTNGRASAGAYAQGSMGVLISDVMADGVSILDIQGGAQLDGTWQVIDTGAPLGRFDVLTAGAGITGTFDIVTLPNADWMWGIHNGDTLWVQHVPEPATLSLLALGGLALLRRKRGCGG